MILPKTLTRETVRIFVVRFLALFAVLAWPWPGLGRAFVLVFSALTNVALGVVFGSPAFAPYFGPDEKGGGASWDAALFVRNSATGAIAEMGSLEIRRVSYLPMIVFLALCFAAPRTRWQKELLVLLAGLLLLQTLPALTLGASFAEMDLWHLAGAARAVLEIAYRALATPPGMAYAVPALLWLLLTRWLDRDAPPLSV